MTMQAIEANILNLKDRVDQGEIASAEIGRKLNNLANEMRAINSKLPNLATKEKVKEHFSYFKNEISWTAKKSDLDALKHSLELYKQDQNASMNAAEISRQTMTSSLQKVSDKLETMLKSQTKILTWGGILSVLSYAGLALLTLFKAKLGL